MNSEGTVQYLYQLSHYLCFVQFHVYEVNKFQEIMKESALRLFPYLIYQVTQQQFVCVKDGQFFTLRPNQVFRVVSKSTQENIEYAEFIEQLNLYSTFIGLKELPFQPLTYLVHKILKNK